MGFMLAKRQVNNNINDDDDDDDLWGYSTVSVNSHFYQKYLAHTSADRHRNQMGCRWRNPRPTRPMARLGTHARATKD